MKVVIVILYFHPVKIFQHKNLHKTNLKLSYAKFFSKAVIHVHVYNEYNEKLKKIFFSN